MDAKRIIASTNSEHNLPSIDYNGLEEDLDIIDIEKLAKNHSLDVSNVSHGFGIKDGFIEGFKKSQSLNNKMFSQEDMKEFGLWLGENFDKFKNKSIDEIFNESPFNKKSNVFDIEVEMENIGGEAVNDIMDYKPYSKIPKILNNKIKIVKLL